MRGLILIIGVKEFFCIRMDNINKFNFVQNMGVNKQERVFSNRTGKEDKSVRILASKCLQLWGFGTHERCWRGGGEGGKKDQNELKF